jgi:hypothetical protein
MQLACQLGKRLSCCHGERRRRVFDGPVNLSSGVVSCLTIARDTCARRGRATVTRRISDRTSEISTRTSVSTLTSISCRVGSGPTITPTALSRSSQGTPWMSRFSAPLANGPFTRLQRGPTAAQRARIFPSGLSQFTRYPSAGRFVWSSTEND